MRFYLSRLSLFQGILDSVFTITLEPLDFVNSWNGLARIDKAVQPVLSEQGRVRFQAVYWHAKAVSGVFSMLHSAGNALVRVLGRCGIVLLVEPIS